MQLERNSCEWRNIELAMEISLKPSDFTILSAPFKSPLLHAFSNKEILFSLETFASLLVQFRNNLSSDFRFYISRRRMNIIFLPSLLKRNSVKKRDKSRPVAVSKRKRNEKIEHKHFPLRKNIKDRDALYFRVLPKFPTCRARNYSSF